MRYKVGDQVTIIDNIAGHQFETGRVVTIVETDRDDPVCTYGALDNMGDLWWFGDDECVPYGTNNRAASWMLDKHY